jgi:hypothetical protein
MTDNNNQEVKSPWMMAQSGSEWAPWEDVPNDIRSQLKKQNRFTKTIDDSSYCVRQYEGGSWVVFKNPVGSYRYASTRTSVDGLYREFQVVHLVEANKLLASSNEFEPVGTDPVKVIDHQFFLVLGKKGKV